MRIEIRVDRTCFRRWHHALKGAMERRLPGAEVRFRLDEGDNTPPAAVASLLMLERLVLRRSRPSFCDPLGAEEAQPRSGNDFAPNVILDCTGGKAPVVAGEPALVLQPLFDGQASEQAMVAALLARSMPGVGIEDRRTGAVVAWGRPSAEAAQGLGGGMEAVLSRVILLVERVLVSPRQAFDRARPSPRPNAGAGAVARFVSRNLATDCARAIFHLCFFAPHWRIGWRLHDGAGVLERGNLEGPQWNVLADPGTRFFADPFPVFWQGRGCVFFEDLDHRIGKGTISGVAFGPEGPQGDVFPVLEEPWHMSYPFVMEHEGVLWMVPESSLSGTIPIYSCIAFPNRWERAGTLLDHVEAADCTLFRHDGLFWMMSCVREGTGGYSDTLAIHYAEDLLGPWQEHSQRPVLVDASCARPAGRVTVRNGRLWRPVQDCSEGYGRALALARIDRLDRDHFSQSLHSRITPGPLWPGGRLHTLNRCGRLECIDGSIYNPRLGALRPWWPNPAPSAQGHLASADAAPVGDPGRRAAEVADVDWRPLPGDGTALLDPDPSPGPWLSPTRVEAPMSRVGTTLNEGHGPCHG